MPARSEERTNARKEEIINACEMLYQTMNFKDITIKEIGNVTSFPEHRYIIILRRKRKSSLHC